MQWTMRNMMAISPMARIRGALNARRNERKSPGFAAKKSAVEKHFDRDFYLRKNADVEQSGIDPLDHYLHYGWTEGRDPHPQFSTKTYLEINPDVAIAGVNPFWHYIVIGKEEGRDIHHVERVGYKAEILAYLNSLECEVKEWKASTTAREKTSTGDLTGRISDITTRQNRRVIVAIGHDHYQFVSGGVQLCIQKEEQMAQQEGITYLSLHPLQPLPRLAHANEAKGALQMVILDGEQIGPVPFEEIVETIQTLTSVGFRIDFVIHHLLGQLPEQITTLVRTAGRKECWFWLHDFFSICPSYTLLRNSVTFCGAPELDSAACTICRYGAERHSHSKRLLAFFSQLDVHMLAPSEVTRDFWTEKARLPFASIKVAPHAKLKWMERLPTITPASDSRLIRIGFIGSTTVQKGWNEFMDLFHKYWDEPSFEFHYFGVNEVPFEMERHAVQVTSDTTQAMSMAIADAEIDFVLHWANGMETFSFSTIEAIAGGAYVITNSGSGNVARLVECEKRGVVLSSSEELLHFFAGSRVHELAVECREKRRRSRADFSLSPMSLPFLLGAET